MLKKKRPKRTKSRAEWVGMKAKYEGTCVLCGKTIKVGSMIFWRPGGRQVHHRWCHVALAQRLDGTARPKLRRKGTKKMWPAPLESTDRQDSSWRPGEHRDPRLVRDPHLAHERPVLVGRTYAKREVLEPGVRSS